MEPGHSRFSRLKDSAIARGRAAALGLATVAALAGVSERIVQNEDVRRTKTTFEDLKIAPLVERLPAVPASSGKTATAGKQGVAVENGNPVAGTKSETAPLAQEQTPSATPRPNRIQAGSSGRTEGGCPQNMARMTNYCIDKWEVHLADNQGSVYDYFKVPPSKPVNLKAVSEPGVYPQGYMSQMVAAAVCKNAGKRLCTLEEWQYACKGAAGRKYPYGSALQAGVCNTSRTPHVFEIIFGKGKKPQNMFNDPRLLRDAGLLGKTDEYPQCITPEGVQNIDGNLSEWVADTIEKPYPYTGEIPKYMVDLGAVAPSGMVYFGYFAGDSINNDYRNGCFRHTNAHFAVYHDYSMGARCCQEAR